MTDPNKPAVCLGAGPEYLAGFCEILKAFKALNFPLIVFSQPCITEALDEPRLTMWQYWLYLDNFTVNFLVRPEEKESTDSQITALAPVVDILSAGIEATVDEIK